MRHGIFHRDGGNGGKLVENGQFFFVNYQGFIKYRQSDTADRLAIQIQRRLHCRSNLPGKPQLQPVRPLEVIVNDYRPSCLPDFCQDSLAIKPHTHSFYFPISAGATFEMSLGSVGVEQLDEAVRYSHERNRLVQNGLQHGVDVQFVYQRGRRFGQFLQ